MFGCHAVGPLAVLHPMMFEARGLLRSGAVVARLSANLPPFLKGITKRDAIAELQRLEAAHERVLKYGPNDYDEVDGSHYASRGPALRKFISTCP